MDKFAERIKELRLEKRLSQRELAKAINVSQAAVAKWEANTRNVTIDYIIALAKFFHVTSDYLLGLED